MSANGLKKLIKKFQDTGSFEVKSVRGRKPIATTTVEDVATELQDKTSSGIGS